MSEKRYDKLPEDLNLPYFSAETRALILSLPEEILSSINEVRIGNPQDIDVELRFKPYTHLSFRVMARDYEVAEEDYTVWGAYVDLCWTTIDDNIIHEYKIEEEVVADALGTLRLSDWFVKQVKSVVENPENRLEAWHIKE